MGNGVVKRRWVFGPRKVKIWMDDNGRIREDVGVEGTIGPMGLSNIIGERKQDLGRKIDSKSVRECGDA
jgi:hypothetical protein